MLATASYKMKDASPCVLEQLLGCSVVGYDTATEQLFPAKTQGEASSEFRLVAHYSSYLQLFSCQHNLSRNLCPHYICIEPS